MDRDTWKQIKQEKKSVLCGAQKVVVIRKWGRPVESQKLQCVMVRHDPRMQKHRSEDGQEWE